jgi:hypothetical protein
MCTAIVSVEPGGPLLLAGIRDEFADRAWQPPGLHWPQYPGVSGGRDLLAGGTWLALAPAQRRVACVLNGRGRMAPSGSRRSRGVLPLEAAAEGKLGRAALADFDPFHLVTASPRMVMLSSWDGERFAGRELAAGLHMIVNSGLASDLLAGSVPAGQSGSVPAAGGAALRADGRDLELARIGHFLPRLRGAARPDPRPGAPVPVAWGAWLPLMNGDGLDPADPRALIVRRNVGDGRIWGTTSISLIALWPEGSPQRPRYDFTGTPGDPAAWYQVPVAA